MRPYLIFVCSPSPLSVMAHHGTRTAHKSLETKLSSPPPKQPSHPLTLMTYIKTQEKMNQQPRGGIGGLSKIFKIFFKWVVSKRSKRSRCVDPLVPGHVSDFIGSSAVSNALTSGRAPCLPPGSGFHFVPKPMGSKDRGQKKER